MADETILQLPDANQTPTELRSVCSDLSELIATQYPPSVIGSLWGMMLISLMGRSEPVDDSLPPVSVDESSVLFAMEYVHAVAASRADTITEFANVEDGVVEKILELSNSAISKAFQFSFSSTVPGEGETDYQEKRLNHEILSNWILIRGKRYQVLEEDFFRFVLSPHEDELLDAYGVGSEFIASQIQKITDSTRSGIQTSADALHGIMEEVFGEGDFDKTKAAESLANTDSDLGNRARDAMFDMFFGGIFNLSKKTKLPKSLLEDLAYEPGSFDQFFDGSDYSGTPFNTLPARIKPLIKISDEFYACDPNFIRDSAYRAIQRGLVARNPQYKETWNRRQKDLTENSFSRLLAPYLKQARVFRDVYYPIGEGQYAEVDCLVVCDDVLIVIECKAGVEPLQSPGQKIGGHTSAVERLIVGAFDQAKRFIDYIAGNEPAPIFELREGQGYKKIPIIPLTHVG